MSSQPRSAIVTGAASGIGRAIALRLASDGFNVAMCDISSQEAALKSLQDEIEAKGRKAIVMVADVSVEKEVNDFVSTVVSEFGGLDVVREQFHDLSIKMNSHWGKMVANAGVAVLASILDSKFTFFMTGHLWLHNWTATMEEWERVFNINVKGTLLCYKAAAKVMIEQNRGGRIIGMYWFSLENISIGISRRFVTGWQER